MNKEIDIFGSCVTRDAFNSPQASNYTMNQYFARTSLISLYSPSLDIKKEGINLDSQFQQRIVFFDLNKVFRSHIATSNTSFLLIDFIDERFDVLKHRDSFLTKSSEYQRSNLPNILNTQIVEKDDKYFQMWEHAAQKLIKDISHRKSNSVVLHHAYWRKEYRDKDGTIKLFPDQKRIEYNNGILNRMYSFVESISQGLIVSINLEDDYVADSSHIWGLSPFHYENKYYDDFINKLNEIKI